MPLTSGRGAVGSAPRLEGVKTEVRLLQGVTPFALICHAHTVLQKHLTQLFHSLSRKQLIMSMLYAAEGGLLRAL